MKEKTNGLESDLSNGKAELQKWKTEKKVVAMESERQIDESQKMISGLKNMVEEPLKSRSPRLV